MLHRKDTILSYETMRDGTPIEIRFTRDVSRSGVYSFHLRQYAELIDRKLTYPTCPLMFDNFLAVYVTANDEVLGHIVYRIGVEHKVSYIVLSAVRKDLRGNGLYEIMHKHFEHQSKINGSRYISSWTHKNNTSRQKSAAKVGLEVKYTILGKYIK